nr:TetR/AcrR family transcriptional regulator [Micromonospora sp. DSM 115978]
IVGTDPELLLPYVLDRRGAAQDLIVELLESDLAQAQAAGIVRAGDPAVLARTVLLVVQSFVLSAQAIGAGVPPESMTDELGLLLDRYLAPEVRA